MTAALKHADRPDQWTSPRWKDPAQAYHRHGPLLGMKEPRKPGLLRRLMGRV